MKNHLKSLYHAVKCELRCQFGHSFFYDYGTVVIKEGVRLDWSDNGKNYFEYVEIKPILRLICSSTDRVTNFRVMKEA